jgi:CXXX repeat radical SAM target protein
MKNVKSPGRRNFLRRGAKALPALAAVGLLLATPLPARADCNDNCAGSCYKGCTGSCMEGCTGSCMEGCTGSCM